MKDVIEMFDWSSPALMGTATVLLLASATIAQDCVLEDDFEDDQPAPTWIQADLNDNRFRVEERNGRVEFWGPANNNGNVYLSMQSGEDWYIDMTRDWSCSLLMHANPITPQNGEMAAGFFLMMEGSTLEPSVRDGIAITAGTYNYGTGDTDYTAVRAWDEGTGYVLATYNRGWTDRTMYFWFDASEDCLAWGYELGSPVSTICSISALSDETKATISLGGYSIGTMNSSSGNRLWCDDFCLIEGTLVGPALGACCVELACSETIEAGCAGEWLGEETTCDSGDTCLPVPLLVPSEYATIQEAIDASEDGDEIIVAPGVHSGGNDTEVFNTMGKQLYIHSSSGQDVTFVNGTGSKRILVCEMGEVRGTVIEGFSFIDGATTGDGGAIRIAEGSSPTIMDCSIRYSSAERGGAVSIASASPAFANCTFIENESNQEGGAIDITGTSNVELIECTVEGNVAGNGLGFAGVNIDTKAIAILTGTVVCGNLPTDLVGDWVDAGGNTVCNPCLGDLTGDGLVDGGDLTVVLGFWGICADPVDCLADLTGDGIVDGADLTMILGFWGPCD